MSKTLKINAPKIAIDADVHIGRTENKSLSLGVVLTGRFSGVTEAQAREIMEAAHKVRR
jgi:organic hydroperoxide reductase OsmC/OhrA